LSSDGVSSARHWHYFWGSKVSRVDVGLDFPITRVVRFKLQVAYKYVPEGWSVVKFFSWPNAEIGGFFVSWVGGVTRAVKFALSVSSLGHFQPNIRHHFRVSFLNSQRFFCWWVICTLPEFGGVCCVPRQ